MIRFASIVLLVPLAAAAQEPEVAIARREFAELLKTSADAPPVSPTVHGRVTDQALVIDDLT